MAKKKNRRRQSRAVNLSEQATRYNYIDDDYFSHSNYFPICDQDLDSESFTTANPTSPSLADRFNALPTELRLEIFSHLLVRPVKWQLTHRQSCYYVKSSNLSKPGLYTHHYPATCVRCIHNHRSQRIPLWRRDEPELRETWTNPWRSEWAPVVQNEFMCSDCWDEEFRPQPHPAGPTGKRHLRCLCARRQDLDVLLVCRNWYEQAASVFYSSNVFAFEDAEMFVEFITNLDERWRSKVTQVSIRAYHPTWFEPSADGMEQITNWESAKSLSAVWTQLRRLPSLSHLELDGLFLTRDKTVKALLRLGLIGLKSVCFTLRNPKHSYETTGEHGSPYIWPEFYDSVLLVGGLAEMVARAVKGQRRAWLKGNGTIHYRVCSEKERQLWLLMERKPYQVSDIRGVQNCSSQRVSRTLYYNEDLEEWKRLWELIGYHHAYLPWDPRALHASVETKVD